MGGLADPSMGSIHIPGKTCSTTMASGEGEGAGPIDCPRCRKPMQVERVPQLGPDVEIDVCKKCGGSWYDRGELEKTVVNRKMATILAEPPIRGVVSPIPCPRCGGRMRTRQEWGVEVDVCTKCDGVWLDHGEDEALRAQADAASKQKEKAKKREASFYTMIKDLSS